MVMPAGFKFTLCKYFILLQKLEMDERLNDFTYRAEEALKRAQLLERLTGEKCRSKIRPR